MAFFEVNNIAVKGISACVPKTLDKNQNSPVFGSDDGRAFIATTGIEERRIAPAETCTSDLCFSAAEKLVADLGWNKEEIECLVFVSQTPDYHLPATACLLQDRLGLSSDCVAFDVSLGCSGWVYGFSTISSLMNSGKIKKGLLLAGDTTSKFCSKTDKSTWPLFGDAGTATALEYSENTEALKFALNTEGGGITV